MTEADKFLNNLVKEAEDQADSLSDKGHWNLIGDLSLLLKNASNGLYHDFHRAGLAGPKVGLVIALQDLIDNVKQGKYDN